MGNKQPLRINTTRQTASQAARLLILLGFSVCVVSPYFVLFGLPIYLIGSLAFITTSTNKWQTIRWISLPLLLYVPVSTGWLAFYGYATRVPPTDYILPDGFTGRVTIYFDESCGERFETLEGRRQFEIPESGVLVLQTEYEAGLIDNRYFMRAPDTPPQLLPIHQRDAPLHPNQVGVLRRQVGVIGYDGPRVRYEQFYVGTLQELNKQTIFDERDIDTFTTGKLYRCRGLPTPIPFYTPRPTASP